MSKDEAMKLALEALKMNPLDTPTAVYDEKHNNAIKALEETLANHCEDNLDMVKQEQGEPVAKLKINDVLHRCNCCGYLDKVTMQIEYTTPQQRTWVDLTEDEMVSLRSHVQEYTPLDSVKYGEAIQRATAQALEEKNT